VSDNIVGVLILLSHSDNYSDQMYQAQIILDGKIPGISNVVQQIIKSGALIFLILMKENVSL
jgi:hypothetical protein